MFKYRVITMFPDKSYGIALCLDEGALRKILVRDRDVVEGKLQIGSLIECAIAIVSGDARYSGQKIRVLR